MVQSSNMLREPTMDEILTSIREIMRENGEFHNAPNLAGHAPALAEADAAFGASVHTVPPQGSSLGFVPPSSHDAIEEAPNGNDAQQISIEEAMRLLSERIGLQEPPSKGVRAYQSGGAASNGAAPFNGGAPSQQETQQASPVMKEEPTMAPLQEERATPLFGEQRAMSYRRQETREEAAASIPRPVDSEEKEGFSLNSCLAEEIQKKLDAELRPMISVWLERHLPAVVERILTEELGRVLGKLER